ncbi:MAG: hypothetical protein KF773_38240 [Deltaproteobacteria bacterium]|nr:hypothetical protein [Deltaproteobacteria bacterium]MCW5808209.1 hypothetical protein [Deltaproteobacteria bacterium]
MRLRNIVAVVALGAPSVAAADKRDDEFRAFSSSKYTYCDAKVLSSLWKSSIADSKATIGRKVIARHTVGLEKNLELALDAAYKNPRLRCRYHEAGFTFEDAKKLSKMWRVSVAEAKTQAEEKIAGGGEGVLNEILGKKAVAASNEKELEAFFSSKYRYCDAKLLAGMWKSSIEDAKVSIGTKVMAKNPGAVERLLNDARKQAQTNASMRCSFYDAGYTYEDIERLAKIWKKSITDSKAFANDKIFWGLGANLDRLLGRKP